MNRIFMAWICTGLILGGGMSEAEKLAMDPVEGFVPIEREIAFLEEPNQALFQKVPETFVWISDIERVTDEHTGEVFLADVENPSLMCCDRIPGDREFTLFPYHFYEIEEEKQLGQRIHYQLTMKNVASVTVEVELFGMGTTTDWDHYKAWQGALRGDSRQVFTLAPGETRLLWEERDLVGGYPWSGIIFGRATGDLMVCDYAFLGDEAPDISRIPLQPDLTWEPHFMPSFTRGTADWNAAEVVLFPENRTAEGDLPLSSLDEGAYAVAIAYSPGGPINDLCEYNEVEPTFREDILAVKDPLSQRSHMFFGGNYPIQYRMTLPVVNDTTRARTINFYLCSNDIFTVDTIAGVWMNNRMLHRQVPILKKNEHWKVFSLTLEPGDRHTPELILIPLGSRWGAMIATIEITP